MPSHERKLYYPDDSDNDPRRDIRATGMHGRWSMDSEVEIWRTGSLLDCFFSLLTFSSLDLGTVQMASARVFTTYHWRWSFRVRRIRRKVDMSCTNWLWDLWVRTIAYVERLFGCFLSVSFLSYSCTTTHLHLLSLQPLCNRCYFGCFFDLLIDLIDLSRGPMTVYVQSPICVCVCSI